MRPVSSARSPQLVAGGIDDLCAGAPFRVMLGLVSLTAMALGCHHAPLAYDRTPGPYPEVLGRPRSIVFDAPKLQEISVTSGLGNDRSQAWYASRNDVQRSTVAGYRSAIADRLVTFTYDRQSIVGGQSRDSYQSTTYRLSTSRMVR